MSLLEYYEDSFRSEKRRPSDEMLTEVTSSARGLSHFVQESKQKFLPHLEWERMKVLVTGSGSGGLGLLLAKLGSQVTLLDFSPSANEIAEKLFSLEGFPVTTILADVTYPDANLPDKYDLIVDSHLLHCLIEDPGRSSYYQLIKDHLAPDGICVIETMVHRKKLFIPDGFMFDAKNILWQMFGKWTPVRRILDSLDLEQELNANFRIVSFFYYAQFGFAPHRSFMEIPAEVLPAAVRTVVANKPE